MYDIDLYSFVIYLFFFFKQKTAYEMRISDWSSDVCSSDLLRHHARINPVGEVDLVVGKQGAHGIAQQGRVVARQRRDQQHHRVVLQILDGAGDRKSTRLNSSH